MWTVATYVLKQKLRGRKRYPLVLMLEPLFRCNLACAGCGKIQYPAHILKKNLTPEQCFKAVEECGAPMVSIPGGEPLLHPQIKEIVEGLVARKKYIYLCTNALLLKEKIDLFTPSKYLTFSVHMDGQKDHHDFAVCREGTYDTAVEGIREAVKRGFRVTTNTTLFDGADSKSVRVFFDEMMALAEAVLPAPGRLHRHVRGTDRNHGVGALRHRKRQPPLRQLHGPQRLRSQRGEPHVQPQGHLRRRKGDVLQILQGSGGARGTGRKERARSPRAVDREFGQGRRSRNRPRLNPNPASEISNLKSQIQDAPRN